MKIYRKPTVKTVFKQYDSRWGKLPYPTYPSTVAQCGCGCCSVTHCAIELDKYADYTPKKTQPFMKQYAEKGHGTYWSGITKGLNKYGLKDIKEFNSMAPFFEELEKGSRIGILLFGNNTAPDGTLWTAGGHYIAFTGYKVGNGKHWFYTKDSGGRGHDGWYSYESSMKGCLKHMWTCRVPHQPIILPERGYFKYGDSGDSVKAIQRFLKEEGLYKGKIGGHYRTLTRRAVRKFQEKYHEKYKLEVDGFWGKQCTALYIDLVK